MHRSGTSLLTGILQHLGVCLPGQSISGDVHNPEGYFEWEDIVDVQERLLIDLQRWWPAYEGTLDLPPNWLHHPATRHAYEQLLSLVQGASEKQTCLWAIKDPRCSRFLPLWVDICLELSIPLRVLLAVRDPSEVVTSLVRRDGPLVGMDSLRAQQLWWRFNLEAVHASKQASIPWTVVDFNRWFLAPENQIKTIENLLPELSPSLLQREQAIAFIKPQHRRSVRDSKTPRLHSSVRRLHRRLLREPLPSRWPAVTPPFAQRIFNFSAHDVSISKPDFWPAWIESHKFYPAPRFTDSFSFGKDVELSVCGLSWQDLSPHLLLQYLPIPFLSQCHVDFERSHPHQLHLSVTPSQQSDVSLSVERIALNFELPPAERASHWLLHLRSQQLIFDPVPARVLLLRAMGLPAWWIDPNSVPNGWLQIPQAVDVREWGALLGLSPPPQGQLLVLGSAGAVFERGLMNEMSSTINKSAPLCDLPIAYWPGWNELVVDHPLSGLLRAGWLQSAAHSAARLVFAGAEHSPSEWDLLHLPVPYLVHLPDSSPAELRACHFGQQLIALAQDQPLQNFTVLQEWSVLDPLQHPPLAAVLVSLYNYADYISEALESVRAQTQKGLELIIVDDASTDSGTTLVERWIEDCLNTDRHPFVRVLFLRHEKNAGLAAARNTAFHQSQAPWSFVLDADNLLFPDAVSGCLSLADMADPDLAVVHPLLAVDAEIGRPDDLRTLVSSASWQKERLKTGNVVDAMALVRRSAWEVVGGYTHIQGGWEDYDFWCKLVAAGFYGIQCPRILAVYRSHAQSMSHQATNHSWHALSRTLQQRHPWLQLPLAQLEDA